MAHQVEDQAHLKVGRLLAVAGGRRGYEDVVDAGLANVDAVKADAVARDDLQLLHATDDLGRQVVVAEDERVRVPGKLEHLLARQRTAVGVEPNLAAGGLQPLERVCDRIAKRYGR